MLRTDSNARRGPSLEHLELPLEWARYAPLEVVLRLNILAFWACSEEPDGRMRMSFSIDDEFGHDVLAPADLAARTNAHIEHYGDFLFAAQDPNDPVMPFRHADGRLVTVQDCLAHATSAELSPPRVASPAPWVPAAHVARGAQKARKTYHLSDVVFVGADLLDWAERTRRGLFRLAERAIPRPKTLRARLHRNDERV